MTDSLDLIRIREKDVRRKRLIKRKDGSNEIIFCLSFLPSIGHVMQVQGWKH